MVSPSAAATSSIVQQSFEELEKQRELIASCTVLWKELNDHFSSLERGLEAKSESLRSKREFMDLKTKRKLDSLDRRELSIDAAVDLALSKLDERCAAAVQSIADPDGGKEDLVSKLRSLCTKMDSDGFVDFVVAKRKEVELLRSEVPLALADCVDPAIFVLDAIAMVFPVDKRAVKSPNDLGWACIVILESLVPVLADPELGSARLLVTRGVKERAKEMAEEWKEAMAKRGGIESAKPPDAHAFLQHVVTFGIAMKEDRDLYRRIVVSFSWRRQMPKLAIAVGLEDEMEGIIEELIRKGQQLDAVNFAYEAGLQNKFPPIPLLKSFLKGSRKVPASTSDDCNNTGQSVNNANKKEHAALRAVIKCIEDRKLEADFPTESLQKRLENMEKPKVEKKKPVSSGGGAGPANKRTRTNNGGPMPPAKAGRLTNNAYVSSFPNAPTYVRSPSAHTSYSAAPPYPYDTTAGHGHGVYGSRSPPAIREPYPYTTEEVANAGLGMAYPSPPMNYPPIGVYPAGLGGYSNPVPPMFQHAYYR